MKQSCIAAASFVACVLSQSPPQVDLGYEIHQAVTSNDSDLTWNFTNIRYAQPPVGDLRFAAPVPPTGRNPVVQNGSYGPICPQASPLWSPIGSEFAVAFAEHNESNFNYSAAVASLQAQGNITYTPSPQESEDCLFLDVIVPKTVFNNANNKWRKRSGTGAPVLLWIYGGGYVLGSKSQGGFYNPTGLIQTSQQNGTNPGLIYVAINYRLGAMGWLAGPTMQSQGAIANAALYDQRLAIEWVKANIAKFGGDPNQITLMGESAGGGSIMHQITAFGGQQGVSFQRAIPQSPGWLPISSTLVMDNSTATFLNFLNVSTIEEARNAPSADVLRANYLTVAYSRYGTYTFGPAVDGVFVPTQPGLALLSPGSYASNVSVMAGHNTNEGPLFTPPYVTTNQDLASYLQQSYPSVPQSVVNYILNDLYPPVYDGSQPYTSPIDRTIVMVTEQVFTCNTHYLAKAYGNQTWNYQFEVLPALHGVDVASTFYNGAPVSLTSGLYPPVAMAMQKYITNFALYGTPNGAGQDGTYPFPYFPQQEMNATEMGLNYTVAYTAANGTANATASLLPDIRPQTDPTANRRCDWWQKAYYL